MTKAIAINKIENLKKYINGTTWTDKNGFNLRSGLSNCLVTDSIIIANGCELPLSEVTHIEDRKDYTKKIIITMSNGAEIAIDQRTF
jgi:hypothetical protein